MIIAPNRNIVRPPARKPQWLIDHLVKVKGDPAYLPDGRKIVLQDPNGKVLYAAWPKQLWLHECTTPKALLEGERGTGKSHSLRWDCHLPAMAFAGYKYLILRRTMPELRKSHLKSIGAEMRALGGRALGINAGSPEAHYPNGSVGIFGHCETEADIEKYLSAEFHKIVFDEIVTFDWDMVTRISTSCRVPEGSGLIAMVRGGTNPMGTSADEVYRHFIGRDITFEEDEEYDPADWTSLHMTMDDNPSLDKVQYLKQFAGVPDAYKKAWLRGEWGVEGAYFTVNPENLVTEPEVIDAWATGGGYKRGDDMQPFTRLLHWVHVYRLFDYGWHDPSVCLWVAVLPSGREIVFREHTWNECTIQQIAKEMKALSDGMRVVTTICDETLGKGEKEMGHCLADEMELMGIGCTKGVNDRTAGPRAVQLGLSTLLEDGRPKTQILVDEVNQTGCTMLVKTLRAMRVDKKRPGRMADHKMDHMPVCLGYFRQAGVGPSHAPVQETRYGHLLHAMRRDRVLGQDGVRKHY
jgi:hypothetical protein